MTLVARDLSIGHHRKVLGTGIDIAVAPGEIVCLLGPNGCGKTTLLKTLLGLLPPLGGRICLDGTPLDRLDRTAVARRVAYVPQQHVPPFPYRVRDVVAMGRTARLGPFAQPGAVDRDAVDEALRRLGIAELADRDYSRLSGGQRQLVLIARALAQDTPLLVLDEPTASLDFGNQAIVLGEIAGLARAAAADGRGVILSTHAPDQAFALEARVLLMRSGRVLAGGEPDVVLTSERLSDAYGTPVIVERTSSGRRVCAPLLGARHGSTGRGAGNSG